MIQIWREHPDSTKYALFIDGETRFATMVNGTDAATVRSALLASEDVLTDIQPRLDRSILWHDDDRSTIAAWYQQMIDDAQATALQQVIGADIYRYIVYILKFLELMSVELGLRTMDESVILSHEADAGQKAELAATWSSKSSAWLNVVGVAEREASAAKKAISAASNDFDMRAIVEAFPATLNEALQ